MPSKNATFVFTIAPESFPAPPRSRRPGRRFRPTKKGGTRWGQGVQSELGSDWQAEACPTLHQAGPYATKLLDSFVRFHLAVADVNDAVGVQGDIVFVGDQDDGIALLVEAFEEAHDFVAGGGIEVAGGLVGQQNGRVVDERAGDRDALALAAGKLVRLVVHAGFQIDLAHGYFGALQALGAGHAGVDQGKFHVVQRGGAGQQVEGLEDEADLPVADARQLVVGHLADQVAVDVVQALGGGIEAADQVHEGGFTGTGRSHDGDVFAAFDFDIDAGDGVENLFAHHIGLPEIVGADDNTIALELLAPLDQFLLDCCWHWIVSRFYDLAGSTTGALLSIFTWVSLRMVRIT